MIRNENEYKEAVNRIAEEEQRLNDHAMNLRDAGLDPVEVDRVMEPMRSFHEQLKEEVESYERLKRGEFDELLNLKGTGQLLVSLRIALGITQRELADRLGVNESQVSRDERNEYNGIRLDRATKILEVLGVEIRTRVDVIPPSERAA